MAGRRPLSRDEERRLLRVVRRMPARDALLVTAQWLTGLRISETLSLRVGSVEHQGQLLRTIGVAPRHLKGHYGKTRWVPVLPELSRAIARQLGVLRRRFILQSDFPLFLSREGGVDGTAKSLSPKQAALIIRRAFLRAGILDDGRLGTHSLRKTFARNVYRHAGNDLMVLKAALGHSDVSITQAYLEPGEDVVSDAIRRCDFTRGPRKRKPRVAVAVPVEAVAA